MSTFEAETVKLDSSYTVLALYSKDSRKNLLICLNDDMEDEAELVVVKPLISLSDSTSNELAVVEVFEFTVKEQEESSHVFSLVDHLDNIDFRLIWTCINTIRHFYMGLAE